MLNDAEVVQAWVERIREQLERFLDFDGVNAAVLVNNLDWTAVAVPLDFLRDVGKHFSVNRMLAREAVAAAARAGEGSATPSSATSSCSPGLPRAPPRSAARCRPAAATSGATSPPGST